MSQTHPNCCCQRCQQPCDSQICGKCISWLHGHPFCEECGESLWSASKRRFSKFAVLNTRILCKTCYGRRLIPDDKICPECLKYYPLWRSWNKSLGVCRACSKKHETTPKTSSVSHKQARDMSSYRLKRRLELIPDDRICPECHKVVFEHRRWVVKPEGSCCRSCSMKGLIGKPVRKRKIKDIKIYDQPVLCDNDQPIILPDGFVKCFKCGLVHEEGGLCGST